MLGKYLHPLDCLQILKRTATYIPKLLQTVPDKDMENYAPFLTQAYTASLIGLADIQEYYDLNPKDIAEGILKFGGNSKEL